jgi:hypothetical protein
LIDVFICVFNCNSQRIRRVTSGLIYANSYPNTVFKFNFNTPDWDTVLTKTAVFSYRGDNYEKPLDENNMCRVPEEVLHGGAFQVSVYGGNIITNHIRIPVTEKELSTPSTYDEIIELIENHTHEEYVEESEFEGLIPDVFDAGKIIES